MVIKRIFDITFALFGLIIFSPLFVIIAGLIKSTSKGSIFFRQIRVGQYEIPFKIYKFRTMYIESDTRGPLTIGNDRRVTSVGKVLRNLKLDELPQLINVLVGEMSLVGPRPEVPEFVRSYAPEIRKIVFSVKPGITDWASIKMIDENMLLAKSNNPTQKYLDEILPQKLAYAVKYVKTRSLRLDISLILQTCIKIFTR